MGFAVSAEAYDRFMGRFSTQLAVHFAEWAGVEPGMDVLDVGSGPGALSAAVLSRVGPGSVTAVDPMPAFVEALGQRLPTVRAMVAPAEALPFDDAAFDATLANLVVPFMADPSAGVHEMLRVTRPGGTVAASVWQHSEGASPLTPFWRGVHRIDPDAVDEGLQLGASKGQLAGLLTECGVMDVRDTALSVEVGYDSFEEWWKPFTYGVGPAGAFLVAQPPERQEEIRASCVEHLGPAPFTVAGRAWCAAGTA
jgi:SAM-dependent methyltransferase